MGEPTLKRPVKLYNPSLVAAPNGLCPRCAFVAAVRADTLHQCDKDSPLFTFRSPKRIAQAAFFKSTAIVVFDAQLRVLRWTWFLSQPKKQVATWDAVSPRMYVPPGSADGYDPPWAQQVFDARLLNFDGEHLFITYNCPNCKFSLSLLTLTREVTPDGGLRSLRAWAAHRIKFEGDDWLQGRNQALFPAPLPHSALQIQPWMDIVGTLGEPRFTHVSMRCYGPEYETWKIGQKQAHRQECGPSPRGSTIGIDVVANDGREFAKPKVLLAGGRDDAASTRKDHAKKIGSLLDDGRPVGWMDAGGPRISTTTNLERISRRLPSTGAACSALLGVGHLHRSDGPKTLQARRRRRGAMQRDRDRGDQGGTSFLFGSQYTHFFYTLSPRPPHRVLAYSAEFCIASVQDPADCESIQFVTGLSLASSQQHAVAGVSLSPIRSEAERLAANKTRLLLSYGVNDCESKLADISLTRVWQMLRPLEEQGSHAVCE